MSGAFITFEGLEGLGKSTQARQVLALLERKFPGKVILTREPGGTRLGEAIRDLILDADRQDTDGVMETLLLFAARRRHLREVIQPALAAGKIILCDRFTDATFAYQGGGRGVDQPLIEELQKQVQGALRPDLTLLLDAPEETSMARVQGRAAADRFEAESLEFFRRVRRGYLGLAKQFPERIRVIDAAREEAVVAREIRDVLAARGWG